MRNSVPIITVALFALLLGCASSSRAVRLTEQDIDTLGSRTFQAARDQVFVASVAALRAQGYEIVFEDAERGLVVTGQKLVRTYTTTEAYNYGLLEDEYTESRTVNATRQYLLQVGPETADGVTVRAEPRVFIGSQDVSADEVWEMEGPAGEPALWDQLFAQIESML